MSGASIITDVIIADNDYIVRSILRSVLERQNLSVLVAIDGVEAVDYAKRTNALLVILDYKMPRLDGFAACAAIRQLPGYLTAPIIVLSAFDDDDTRAAAQRAGATMFVAKPFSQGDLLQTIAMLLGSPILDDQSAEATALVWKRWYEPAPLYGEPTEFSEGRRILNICRR